jgi:head-tail adaptor
MRSNAQIKAGDLRERITFYTQGLTADGYGGFTNVPAEYYTCWASVVNNSGARTDDSGQKIILNNWEIILRDNTSKPINKTMYLVFGSLELIIQEIIVLRGYDRVIKIMAKERG